MKLLHRRIVYSIFVGIFLVAAPLIVFYTMGYRYNLDKGRVQKTGVMKITTVPRGADIYLNGVKYETSQTPAKVEYLLPGDYEIKLTKDGYYDWRKKLAVAENGTTFAEKIMLFKKSSAEAITESSTVSWLVSPDKNMIAVADNLGNVSLIDINSGLMGEISGGNIDVVARISGMPGLRLTAFSPTGRYIIGQDSTGTAPNSYLIDTLLKTAKKLPSSASPAKWAADKDLLYALDKSGLSQIDLSTMAAKVIAKKISGNDFYVFGNSLYILTDDGLIKSALNGESTATAAVVSGSGAKIDSIRNNRALISRESDGNLQIADLNQKIKTVSVAAKDWEWLDNGMMMIYNDYEIFTFDLGNNYPELITRVGSKITAAAWHPAGRHIIFSADGKIGIIELDNREFRNITEINNGSAEYIAIDRAGKNIYFSGGSNGKSGVYKLNIQ